MFSRYSLAALVLLFAFTASQATAQKHFGGPFIDIGANQEHIIGGSFIDGIDVLSEDTRTVFSAGIGYRYQFDAGLVIGVSVSKGWFDGDLNLEDNSLSVDWKNDSQWDWEIDAGWVVFDRFHLFAFASEVTREFKVAISQGTVQFSQTDEQGMLRFGVGGEAHILRGLSARLKVGTGRADFGDAITSIDIERKAHVSAGLRFTF